MSAWLMRPEQIPSRFGPGPETDETVFCRPLPGARTPDVRASRASPRPTLLRRLAGSVQKDRSTSVAAW